ncbi:MAG: lipid-A-disaccharide synthase, partial [Pseudomonadota bacterium]
MTTILLTACEASGDAMGASLMEELRALRPETRFIGGGGAAMQAAGLKHSLPTDRLAVMGPWDALLALPRALKLCRQLADLSAQMKPDAAVLIDSWAFSKLAAQAIRKASPGTKLVKLAVPQVWASRPQRAAVAAELFDLLLCLFAFEPAYFEREGGSAAFVGNPNFQMAAKVPRSGDAFKERRGLTDGRIVALLPGSRAGELKHLLPIYRETAQCLCSQVPDLRLVMVAAPAMFDRLRQEVATWANPVLVVSAEERMDVFAASDVALAASGTVTTELAIAGTPMVVAYKIGPLTAFWAKRVITTEFITILNIAAGREVVPERIQD